MSAAPEDPTAISTGALADWPARPWILAGLLGFVGLVFQHFVKDSTVPWRAGVAASALIGGAAAALTMDRDNWKAPLAFSAVMAVLMGGLTWQFVRSQAGGDAAPFALFSGALAVLLAVPLFQAGFQRTRFKTPYRDTHFHVWSDVISAGGALAFMILSWLLAWLLASLFGLLKIALLREMLGKEWFAALFLGTAFGAALGVLRNELNVLGTLQRVVMLVLAILAVPLAIALAVFIAASALAGPQVLWDATRSATPVLLACAAGAFVLVNAIIRDDDADMSKSRLQRLAALILALGLLPLTLFAAVSLGTRVAQHGLSPERLWGLCAIAVAVAYGLAYAVVIARSRGRNWQHGVRQANLNLAAGVMGFSLLLALPIFDFGAIAARQQIARLKSGAVAVSQFDFSGLRWDFGPGGRTALARLVKDPSPEVARLAAAAVAEKEKSYRSSERPDEKQRRKDHVRFSAGTEDLRPAIMQMLDAERWRCTDSCTIVAVPPTKSGVRRVALVENGVRLLLQFDHRGALISDNDDQSFHAPTAIGAGKVGVRPFNGFQVYVDGQPIGQPFE